MEQQFWDDRDIIKAIGRKGKHEEEGLRECFLKYRYLIPVIQKEFSRFKGVEDTAEDLFHEAMLTIRRKIHNQEIAADISLEGYLKGIIRQKQFGEYRTRQRRLEKLPELLPLLATVDTPVDVLLDQEIEILVNKAIDALEEECREILMYYKNGYKLREIWLNLKLKSYFTVKKKIKVCREKLKKYLLTHRLQNLYDLGLPAKASNNK